MVVIYSPNLQKGANNAEHRPDKSRFSEKRLQACGNS